MGGMATIGVRRAKAAFLSGCESRPAILLQPEAIGAVMKVWLSPRGGRTCIPAAGDNDRRTSSPPLR